MAERDGCHLVKAGKTVRLWSNPHGTIPVWPEGMATPCAESGCPVMKTRLLRFRRFSFVLLPDEVTLFVQNPDDPGLLVHGILNFGVRHDPPAPLSGTDKHPGYYCEGVGNAHLTGPEKVRVLQRSGPAGGIYEEPAVLLPSGVPGTIRLSPGRLAGADSRRIKTGKYM